LLVFRLRYTLFAILYWGLKAFQYLWIYLFFISVWIFSYFWNVCEQISIYYKIHFYYKFIFKVNLNADDYLIFLLLLEMFLYSLFLFVYTCHLFQISSLHVNIFLQYTSTIYWLSYVVYLSSSATSNYKSKH